MSGLMMLAFWGALIVGVVLLARWASGQWTGTTGSASAEDPLAILRRRYAAGEIDEPTYRRMRAELSEREGNAPGPVAPMDALRCLADRSGVRAASMKVSELIPGAAPVAGVGFISPRAGSETEERLILERLF